MLEKVNKIIILVFLLISFISICPAAGMCSADEAQTIKQAFSSAAIKGTIGSYFEFTDADAVNSNFGWANSYLTLKYETQEWNRVRFAARFFAHGQLYSDHDNSTADPFASDIETPYTLPELYLNCGVMDASAVTIGRWNHEKMSHIDDAQSEGGYLSIKEISGFELTGGFMNRFAEIDYDDGEDFGCINKSQDLDSEYTYGIGSQGYLLFIEASSKPCNFWEINPYLMHQSEYATVYGVDTKIEKKDKGSRVLYGSKINYYFVKADISNSSDSSNFALFPYVLIDNFEIILGYASFDKGDSLNKPVWLRDYFTLMDQQKEYAVAGSRKYFTKVKFSFDKFWMHLAYADNNYDFASSRGDRSEEIELQFGYNFTKYLDLNIRLFDVRYDKVDDKDYNKIESRFRFNF